MLLESFKPRSCLITKSTSIQSPRFPVIDVHNHLGEEFGGDWINRPIQELVDLLDSVRVIKYIDLDGGWGEKILIQHVEALKSKYPERFQVFGGVNWEMWKTLGEGFPEWAAARLKSQASLGADGVKVWKNFGLKVRDHHDELVSVDDVRLDPIWTTAAELNFPIMIHVADPVAFFSPLDEINERWEELSAHPDWHFPSPPYPTFNSIIKGLANLIKRHRRTMFIGAHVGCYAENLSWVGDLLETCPNFFVDISARIGELGRQPYTARRFFTRYADRILFGSDFGPDVEAYRLAYRFLESDDEYFNYNTSDIPLQGRWYAYGLHLPDEVLEKIYNKNAEKVLFNSGNR
jgi:predicted TIM-barrel fold metal-dependent hydrolase